MVDALALGITHLLLALAAWRLLLREDLDHEAGPGEARSGRARMGQDLPDD